MTVTTYGEHSENAAQALNALIRHDVLPSDEQAVDQLLHCRETVVDALRQLLYDLGQDSWYPPPDHLPARTPKPTLAGLDEKLASLVDNIAFALPTLPLEERRAHPDYLTPASTDRTVESWRTAAIELLSASHALSAAEAQPWRTDPGAGWWVMRDVAVALEAVLVLDSRLEEVGLLAEHHRPEFSMGLDEKRMVLSQAARVATWHATSASPEEATPRLRQPAGSNVVEPVSLVSTPSDLAAAQQRLARFLRPMVASDSFYAGEPEISADSARQVTASQLYLCRAFAAAASQSPKTATLAAFFNERAEVLESLQPQISHLADVRVDQEPNMRRFWQQSELTTAVARMEDHGVALALQPTQMVELAQATHEVTHNLGKALRRELLRGTSNLVDAHPRHRDGPIRVGRRSRLEATLTDLVNMPAPSEPAARFSNPLQRAALQQTLNLTPTASSRTPMPFPAARSTTYGAPAF
ncbi:hypothetical protein [Paenarthrobacter aurescens]|jgi:hypothetical protein|uniref:Uncharacterized protein n=1 Tax=Paenarthrobacter aurescens (strain TC1) TaxID=290340 RepID=A1RD49_PAEAT|nr:hypothetical protein [Paenarthrobacter aurescens]ABM10551.1 hypothetical protein AAur_pTC10292 [Paenarthrobacter aurescens TC1]